MSKHIANAVVSVMTRKMKKEDEKLYELKQDVADVQEVTNIYYDENFAFDYYISNNKSQNKMYIVDIHGGGWVYGDKKLNRHFCMHLANHNFPVFNINYGLVPTYSVKQQVQHIIKALHYIQNHAIEYGIENYQLCLSGDSAGAHLASLVACIIQDKQLCLEYEVHCDGLHVDCLLLQHGIYDLKPMKHSKSYPMKKLYQWMFPKEHTLSKNCLSAYITKEWNIPIYLLSSEQDTMFCPQTKQLAAKLTHLGIKHNILLWDNSYEQLRHVFHIAFPDMIESQMTIASMVEFLHDIMNPCVAYPDIS